MKSQRCEKDWKKRLGKKVGKKGWRVNILLTVSAPHCRFCHVPTPPQDQLLAKSGACILSPRKNVGHLVILHRKLEG